MRFVYYGSMKERRVFLSVQTVPYRRPAGADPFTYREKRPLRHRASWWTRGSSSELYQSKLVPSQEEAVRLALAYLERWNKTTDTPLIDTTDHPERYGYTKTPEAFADTRKSHAQIKREVDEVLAGRHTGTLGAGSLPKVQQFSVDIENQPRGIFGSAEEAFRYGERHVYLHWPKRFEMLERLKRGETVAWNYGFKSVEIAPL
jgi:hypothetical protein